MSAVMKGTGWKGVVSALSRGCTRRGIPIHIAEEVVKMCAVLAPPDASTLMLVCSLFGVTPRPIHEKIAKALKLDDAAALGVARDLFSAGSAKAAAVLMMAHPGSCKHALVAEIDDIIAALLARKELPVATRFAELIGGDVMLRFAHSLAAINEKAAAKFIKKHDLYGPQFGYVHEFVFSI